MSNINNYQVQQDPACPECEVTPVEECAPELRTDCVVVDSLICSKRLSKVAELTIPVATLGDIIEVGPGGVISPLITLQPDINGIVSQITVAKDTIINTGYLPANITVLGITTPIQVNLPFQEETSCPGACPEDKVQETPFKVEAVITQGIEALGVGVANILFKVILSTNLTVSRPVITKNPDLQVVRDANPDRCK